MAEPTPPRPRRAGLGTVTGWTILFMVLLRVAIGWHFLYEGISKVQSDGAFSATPYLMASVGPLKKYFHAMVDDMDGTAHRMTKQYLYDKLDQKLEVIKLHYGIEGESGYQRKERVDELQQKANGGLTDVQFNWLIAKQQSGKLTQEDAEELEAAYQKKYNGLTRGQVEVLVKKREANELTPPEREALNSALADRLTPNERAELERESRKLTREQVKSLEAFVERKKHGIVDPLTVVNLFENGDLFTRQYRYAGEFVKADGKNPNAADKTDFVTEVVYAPVPDKQDAIVAEIEKILKDLDDTVLQGANDPVLAYDLTEKGRNAQLEKLKKTLEPVKIVPAGAADASWITPGYVHSLVEKRYDALRAAYDLTDRQHQSKYGWRYRDQKKQGHHDRKNVDFIIDSPAFKDALADYVQLLGQIEAEERDLQADFHDQRLAFNTKKRDALRTKLLSRAAVPGNTEAPLGVEVPLADVDLKTIQDFGEYIGPIKDMTPAQFSVGPVPTNKYPFEFPGNILTKLGIPTPKQTLTYYQDMAMMVGLLVIGACLMLGLFTRLASLGGAAMLLMFYLAMPPFPGAHVPENAAEGHYLFVNKNLIEMLALLMFATSGIGRWFGIDSFIHALFGRRRYEPAEVEAAAPSREPVVATQDRVYIPEPLSTTRDGKRG